MWIGNVRNLSFQDQLRATIAVDLNELSMTPLDFDRNLAKGLSARDMRMMAADAGVSLPILDPMASWGAALALGNIGCRLDGVSWLFGGRLLSHCRAARCFDNDRDRYFSARPRCPGPGWHRRNYRKPRKASLCWRIKPVPTACIVCSSSFHCGVSATWHRRGRSFRSRTVRTPALRSTFGTTSGAGGTTRSCDRFREARSPMFR
jgi:hypothetical protein